MVSVDVLRVALRNGCRFHTEHVSGDDDRGHMHVFSETRHNGLTRGQDRPSKQYCVGWATRTRRTKEAVRLAIWIYNHHSNHLCIASNNNDSQQDWVLHAGFSSSAWAAAIARRDYRARIDRNVKLRGEEMEAFES
jgi:hypothetical protein